MFFLHYIRLKLGQKGLIMKTVLKPVNQGACKNGYFKLCEIRITLILGQNFETCILASHGRIIRLPAVFVLWVIALNRPLDRTD